MKNLTFNNNDEMPAIGLGTWKSAPGEVYKAVLDAIEMGYRHFDCAPRYENEPEIGDAFRHAISEKLVNREELWITTKLWNNSHSPEDVEPAIEASLEDLKLDYLDLYLIHWPVLLKWIVNFPKKGEDFLHPDEIPVHETWSAMEKCVSKGLIRHIGVSNFSIHKLQSLISKATIKPELNQVEMHPFLQQNKLLEFCKNENMHLTAYSPLGSRDRLAWLKQENEPSLLEHPVINKIAGDHHCSPAQVILAWSVNRATAAIPKSVNPVRMKENLEAADILLNESEMKKISGIDRHYRYITGSIWVMPGSPYTLENIWDE